MEEGNRKSAGVGEATEAGALLGWSEVKIRNVFEVREKISGFEITGTKRKEQNKAGAYSVVLFSLETEVVKRIMRNVY